MNKALFSILICLGLVGCGDINDFTVKIEKERLASLKLLEPIIFTRTTPLSLTDQGCTNRMKIGPIGYYITSKGTSICDKKAIWKYAVEMESMRCPNMTLISQNNEVLATKIDGSPSDYNKSDVEKCILKAIELAPTENRPTSESVANEESWG